MPDDRMHDMKRKVQVSIPFAMLHDTYLERFLAEQLNPEISIGAEDLGRFERVDFVRIVDELRRQSLRITLHGPFMDLAPGSADNDVRAITRRRLEQLLDLVPIFEPHSVVCHAGYDWRRYSYSPQTWYRRSLELWSWLARRLTAAGTCLMLENVYETDPQEMLPLFEPLGTLGVRFCLDAGHQAAFSRAPVERWCRVLAPYIGQLHLHDNLGSKDDHLGLGKGSIDFKGLLATVKSVCPRQPVVTLEVHHEQDLMPSLAYLENIWPW
jgi:sugar phosphate isomerase/epimerase